MQVRIGSVVDVSDDLPTENFAAALSAGKKVKLYTPARLNYCILLVPSVEARFTWPQDLGLAFGVSLLVDDGWFAFGPIASVNVSNDALTTAIGVEGHILTLLPFRIVSDNHDAVTGTVGVDVLALHDLLQIIRNR